MKRNDRKDFIWNALGLSLNAFNSLFFLIAVRYINGVDTAGIFTYAFALCALFYVLSIYFNRSFQVSNLKFKFNDFLTCRILLSILSLTLILVFSFINNFGIFEISVIALLMLFRITESISDCFYGAIHQKSRLYQTGISLSLKAILGLAVFTLVNFLTKNLLLAIASLTIINLLIFFFYDSKNYKKLYSEKIKLNFKNLKAILKTCFPVFLFSALSLYLTSCQKYILPYFESNEIQTIFGILIMPATFLSLIGSYLINPTLNTFTKHFENKHFDKYIKLSKKVLLSVALFGVICTVICYFIGIPILEFVYHLDLSAYQLPLAIIILASTFLALVMIISSLLTVLKENRRQTYIYIIVSIITTPLSIWLIKLLGIFGAFNSFAISSFLLILFYVILLQSKLHKVKKSHGK